MEDVAASEMTPSPSSEGAPASAPVEFQLEIPIGPEWRNIELLRAAILNCAAAVFDDPELSNAVGTVTSELMENAIKYGEWARGDVAHLILVARGWRERVEIDVASPLAVGSPHYAALLATLREIDAFPSPRDAYLARMREIADEPSGSGVSRMGLARIAYEGPCRLAARLDEERALLHVTAMVEPNMT
jgi:hypothetical protein